MGQILDCEETGSEFALELRRESIGIFFEKADDVVYDSDQNGGRFEIGHGQMRELVRLFNERPEYLTPYGKGPVESNPPDYRSLLVEAVGLLGEAGSDCNRIAERIKGSDAVLLFNLAHRISVLLSHPSIAALRNEVDDGK